MHADVRFMGHWCLFPGQGGGGRGSGQGKKAGHQRGQSLGGGGGLSWPRSRCEGLSSLL